MKDKLTIGILAFIKKQKFFTMTSHIFGFCLFVINYSFFDKLSSLNQEFVIIKSKKASEFQRQLAVLEDENILKEINWKT